MSLTYSPYWEGLLDRSASVGVTASDTEHFFKQTPFRQDHNILITSADLIR